MRDSDSIWRYIDVPTLVIYTALVLYGWISIYAAIYEPGVEDYNNIFSPSITSGKQFIWILIAAVIAIFILVVDFKFIFSVPYIVYAISIVALIGVLLFGHEIQGAKSWYKIGGFTIQPSEFAKFATALALAKYLDNTTVKYGFNSNVMLIVGIIALPALLILFQNETGTVLVFTSLVIVLYLDGLNGMIPAGGLILAILFYLSMKFDTLPIILVLFCLLAVLGIYMLITGQFSRNVRLFVIGVVAFVIFSGVVAGSRYFVDNILQDHQRNRIKAWVNPEFDIRGINYQTNNSLVAMSSGSVWGKGYLNGDLTHGDFVPEQYTDFIFTTIGEEQGFVGTVMVISLYLALMIRLTVVTQRQKSKFAKIYGYCVISILFFHFMVNLGMTMGLFPVIGIPLPFFSYGGSALWGFTILLFIFVKLDMHRSQILARG